MESHGVDLSFVKLKTPKCEMGRNLPWWNAICLEGHAIPQQPARMEPNSKSFFPNQIYGSLWPANEWLQN